MKNGTFFFILIVCFLARSAMAGDNLRSIKRIRDLSHQSGKRGTFRALVIGIDEYIDVSRWGMTCNGITWQCPDCGGQNGYGNQ